MPATKRLRPESILLTTASVLYLALFGCYLAAVFNAVRTDETWKGDFTAFYSGWAIVRDGQGAGLYDLNLQAQYQTEIVGGSYFKGGVLPYVYPPHSTLPFVPLTLLPRRAAFWLWTLGQLALLASLIAALYRFSRCWSPWERRLLLTAVLAFPPLLPTLMLGQWSLLITVSLLQFYLCIREGRQRVGVWWLVAASVKPQLVLLPAVALIAAGRKKALAALVLTGAALVLVSSLVLGPRTWPDFVRTLMMSSGSFGTNGVEPANMYNFKALLTLFVGAGRPDLVNLLTFAGLTAAVAATALVWWQRWDPKEPGFDLRIGLTVLLGLLFSPHLNPHDCLALVIPAVLFYSYLRVTGGPRRTAVYLLLTSPPIFLMPYADEPPALIQAMPAFIICALGAQMWFALQQARTGRTCAIMTA